MTADVDRCAMPSLVRRAEVDSAAAEQLFGMLYDELRRLAHRQLRKQVGEQSLSPTTLVHEAYLRMVGDHALMFPDRARFFAYAARVMRALAIDHARSAGAQKRDRQLTVAWPHDEFGNLPAQSSPEYLVELGEALDTLGALDAPLAEVVELHFFAGLSFAEIAALRAVSERTVQRDWQKARLLLSCWLREKDANASPV